MRLSKFLALAAMAVSANSFALTTITATSINPGRPGFWVTYDDQNSDGLMQISEKTSWSTYVWTPDLWVLLSLVSIPNIPSVSTFTPAPGGSSCYHVPADYWCGVDNHGYGQALNAASFTYTVTNATPVPEPESYALALLGLAGVAVAARRQK